MASGLSPTPGALIDTRGCSLPSWSSMITRRDRPVTSSNSSRIVTPSTMSRKTTVPLTSVRMGVVNGSHSTSSLPRVTLPSSLTLMQAPGAQVASVAHDADTALRLAGESGADAHPLEAGVLDLLGQLLVDLVAGLDDDLARERIPNVLRRHAAEHAIAERLDDVPALDERGCVDVLDRPAVVLGDDDVLRHVDEAAGQVPGVRRLESGVGQTLAGAVGRGEVLEHREAFPEVRGDRRLDDLARGLGHEAAHARELTDLLLRAAGARIGHHVDGVELAALLAALELGEHGVGDLLGHVRPDVHDLVVPLTVGDDAVLVLLLDLVDLLPGPVDELALGGGDVHVLDPDAEAGERGVAEADVLQVIEEGHGGLVDRKSVV